MSLSLALVLSLLSGPSDLPQDVVNDIHGAQVLGMKGILVKTGEYYMLVTTSTNTSLV